MQFATTGSKSSFPFFLFHLHTLLFAPFLSSIHGNHSRFVAWLRRKPIRCEPRILFSFLLFRKSRVYSPVWIRGCLEDAAGDEMVREKARREGKRKVLLTMCRSDMIVRGEEGGTYCVWFEFVEEFCCFVCESSYTDLFSSRELWDLIRFWYRVEDASWFFTNVVSLPQLAEHVHDDGNKRVGSFDGYAIPTGENGKKYGVCQTRFIPFLLSCPICFAQMIELKYFVTLLFHFVAILFFFPVIFLLFPIYDLTIINFFFQNFYPPINHLLIHYFSIPFSSYSTKCCDNIFLLRSKLFDSDWKGTIGYETFRSKETVGAGLFCPSMAT